LPDSSGWATSNLHSLAVHWDDVVTATGLPPNCFWVERSMMYAKEHVRSGVSKFPEVTIVNEHARLELGRLIVDTPAEVLATEIKTARRRLAVVGNRRRAYDQLEGSEGATFPYACTSHPTRPTMNSVKRFCEDSAEYAIVKSYLTAAGREDELGSYGPLCMQFDALRLTRHPTLTYASTLRTTRLCGPPGSDFWTKNRNSGGRISCNIWTQEADNGTIHFGRIVDMLYVQNKMMGGDDGTEPLRLIQVHWFQSQKPKLERVGGVVASVAAVEAAKVKCQEALNLPKGDTGSPVRQVRTRAVKEAREQLMTATSNVTGGSQQRPSYGQVRLDKMINPPTWDDTRMLGGQIILADPVDRNTAIGISEVVRSNTKVVLPGDREAALVWASCGH
jgi:hypothetical protein